MLATEKHELAVELYGRGQLDLANRLMGAALCQEQTGEMWNDWAMIQLALGRQEDAERGFRHALKVDPSFSGATVNLAVVLFNAGKTEEALPLLKEALTLATDTQRARLLTMLAQCGPLTAGNGNKTPPQPAGVAPVASTMSVSVQALPEMSASISEAECESALLDLYRRFDSTLADLKQMAYGLLARFPESSETRFFLADVLQASGQADLALVEFRKLQEDAKPNQKRRVEQAIRQCLADRDYFPPDFARCLESNEYAAGINAEIWRDYALREIQRGRELTRIVRERIPLMGRRVLDVGCGYGGTLIAFAEQGADAVGVEVNEERARVGRKRLADLGINADLRLDDICDPDVPRRLGTFDVVVAQDVIEHVLDPAQAIRALTLILRPGGVILVQVGNKYSPDQLLADHHYHLPGITLLARPQAIDYFRVATGFEACHYGVGYWRTERYYRRMFARFGIEVRHLESYGHPDYVSWYSKMVSDVCRRADQEIHPGLRPELDRRVRRRMIAVARSYAQISELIAKSAANPNLVALLSDRLVKRLCVPVWRFIGVKPRPAD
jgi:SAM-dependent methyltransferase